MKKQTIGKLLLFIIIIALSACGFAKNGISNLNSIVKVIKIDRNTQKEEVIFTYKPEDFQQILVIWHYGGYGRDFEVRGILKKERRQEFKNFTSENIANRLGTLLNEEIVQKPAILREDIDYIAFGYHSTKEKAYEIAHKLSNNPSFEDWRKKEKKEMERRKRELLRSK